MNDNEKQLILMFNLQMFHIFAWNNSQLSK